MLPGILVVRALKGKHRTVAPCKKAYFIWDLAITVGGAVSINDLGNGADVPIVVWASKLRVPFPLTFVYSLRHSLLSSQFLFITSGLTHAFHRQSIEHLSSNHIAVIVSSIAGR